MHRMSGVDAQFIYDESPTEPQHTIKVAIIGSRTSRHYTFARLKNRMRARIAAIPPLRWRAVRVPFDLHHPVWIDDPEFDLDYHVRRMAIPAPAGRAELCEMISEISSVQLDPDRPLWELWMLEGFEGDKVVAVFKMSHALADGGACREMLERALFSHPVAADISDDPAAPPELPPGEPLPTRRQLVRGAFRDMAGDLFERLPRLVRRALAVRRSKPARAASNLPSPFTSPRHVFSGRLSRRRAFYFTSAPLAEAKRAGKAFDATLNDVVIATVAGAARAYLAERGELPDSPIIGNMPASTRTEEQRGKFGNRVTVRFIGLPTHLADPQARIRFAHEQAVAAKRDIALHEGAQIEDWFELLPPWLWKMFSWGTRLVARATDVSGGIVVSSVPGPAAPLYAGSVPLENFISVGHMKFIAGLNVTAWSYDGKLNFGLYACRRSIPDLGHFADLLDASFAELSDAAGDSAPARAA